MNTVRSVFTHVKASVQIYWNKRKRLHKKRSSTPTGLVWDTNMAAVSLFWDTNMAAMTSCENTTTTLYLFVVVVSNEVANGFLRDMFISLFLKEKTTSINSFIMWDVSIVT